MVGGPIPGIPTTELKKLAETVATNPMEPVFFHGTPISLDEELIHSYDLKSCWGLTAGNGNLALTCLRQRRAFFGVCLSQAHKDSLLAWLEQRVWAGMQVETDKLFEAGLVELIESTKEDKGDKSQKKGRKRKNTEEKGVKGKIPKPQSDEEDEPGKNKKKNTTKADLLKKIAALTGKKGGKNNGDESAEEEDSPGDSESGQE